MNRTAYGLAAAALLLLPGCSGLQFVDDDGLVITAPADDAQVRTPLTVSWTRAASVEAPAEYAVYVDRVPPRVGQREDKELDERDGVYRTTDTTVVIPELAPRLGARPGDRNKHDITVVMLDSEGRRLSERSDRVEVEVTS